MKINEFGTDNQKKIVLIPGTMMCWKQFSDVIPILENDYHVIAVSTDGFDGDKNTVFTTARDSAHNLAVYIKEKNISEIELVFGESFGSATAAVLFNEQEIRVNSLIMNGPQYFDFGILNGALKSYIPRSQYRFIGKMDRVKNGGRIPYLMKLFTRTDDEKMISMLSKVPDNIQPKTLENCMSEAGKLYKDMEKFHIRPDAKVAVWRGSKEPNMKKAIATIKKIYPNMEDHPFAEMGHG